MDVGRLVRVYVLPSKPQLVIDASHQGLEAASSGANLVVWIGTQRVDLLLPTGDSVVGDPHRISCIQVDSGLQTGDYIGVGLAVEEGTGVAGDEEQQDGWVGGGDVELREKSGGVGLKHHINYPCISGVTPEGSIERDYNLVEHAHANIGDGALVGGRQGRVERDCPTLQHSQRDSVDHLVGVVDLAARRGYLHHWPRVVNVGDHLVGHYGCIFAVCAVDGLEQGCIAGRREVVLRVVARYWGIGDRWDSVQIRSIEIGLEVKLE